MIYEKPEPTTSTANLTKTLGMQIYAKLRSEGGIANTIKLSLFDPENIQKVDKEIQRILGLRGVLRIKEPAIIGEDGDIATPAVMEQIEITSDILTVATVL